MYRILSALILATGLWAAASDQLYSDRILTPAPSKKPRINGATLYGAHPGHPFLYRIPTSGQRPLRFEATGLPAGLKLDPATGIISGTTPPKGEYVVTLRARNALGIGRAQMETCVGRYSWRLLRPWVGARGTWHTPTSATSWSVSRPTPWNRAEWRTTATR